jgi:hypothetical protein
MSGADIPYQLRPNKHVERQLFWELLEHIDHFNPIRDTAYISMGGRFLEDFKQVHAKFGTKKLLSIESDSVVHERQVFNKPIGALICRRMTSGELVTDFERITGELQAKNYIVWLDYASSKDRLAQLGEFESLVKKLAANDVVKITMNASLRTLGEPKVGESQEDFQKRAFERFKNKLGTYFPTAAGLDHNNITGDGIPVILMAAIKNAALAGISSSSNVSVKPLSAFLYNDGFHDMLTVTCILLDKSMQADFFASTRLDAWEFTASDWSAPIKIFIPDLSLKERVTIDGNLFGKSDDEVHSELTFSFNENRSISFEIFKNYVTHYRRYPGFFRAGT